MQPTAPNPHWLVFYVNMIMTGKATAKEQELKGASGGHSAVVGLAVMTQDDGGDDASDVGDTT